MPSLKPVMAAAVLCWTAGQSFADPVYPRGMRVGLEAPASMVLNPAAPRFEDEQRKAAITVLDLPGAAFPEFQSKLFDAANEAGVTVEKREPFAVAAGMGYLMTLRLTEGAQKSRKWVFLTISPRPDIPNLTALVTVDVPEEATSFYTDEKIRAALATIAFRKVPTEEQLSVLPYRLADLAGFRVAQTMPPAGVALVDGPLDRDPRQPSMIIMLVPFEKAPEPAERATYAVELLRSFGIPDFKITASETLRLKGQQTFEVRGEGKDGEGAPVSVVQWIRFGESGLTRIMGITPSAKWADAFPRFRAVRDGLGPKEN